MSDSRSMARNIEVPLSEALRATAERGLHPQDASPGRAATRGPVRAHAAAGTGEQPAGHPADSPRPVRRRAAAPADEAGRASIGDDPIEARLQRDGCTARSRSSRSRPTRNFVQRSGCSTSGTAKTSTRKKSSTGQRQQDAWTWKTSTRRLPSRRCGRNARRSNEANSVVGRGRLAVAAKSQTWQAAYRRTVQTVPWSPSGSFTTTRRSVLRGQARLGCITLSWSARLRRRLLRGDTTHGRG